MRGIHADGGDPGGRDQRATRHRELERERTRGRHDRVAVEHREGTVGLETAPPVTGVVAGVAERHPGRTPEVRHPVLNDWAQVEIHAGSVTGAPAGPPGDIRVRGAALRCRAGRAHEAVIR